ncbi:MAG TPA: tetratricopeptide repeat protein [Streptosporangiaceae bacterium]|nr:tetratricopeptide repeat protein [Streptosporangiaceae bacterium]
MPRRVVYVVCAAGEESLAEQLAGPLQEAGYQVAHNGTIAVGESLVGEAEKALTSGSPIILCATAKAVGSAWSHKIVNAAHGDGGVRVFVVKMERQAFVDQLALDGKIADYCNDPVQAIHDLVDAMAKHFPPLLQIPGPGNATPIAAGGQFLDELTESATLDIESLQQFRRELRNEVAASYPSTLNAWEFLARASLSVDGRLTRTGALLFASNPTAACQTSMVKCARYHGDDRAASRDMETFEGPVPAQIVAARQFVADRVRTGEAPSADQAQSASIYDYPMVAVREIIANALVHRDYMSTHSCVHVRLFPDRLEVSSPGSWLGQDLQPDVEYKLADLPGHSLKRNFRLAHILSWIRLVEGEGSGIPATLHACRTESSPPPTVVQQQGFVTVTLRRKDQPETPSNDAFGEVATSTGISLGPGLRSSLNCSILVMDMADFGDYARGDTDRTATREAFYDILKSALEEAEVSWAECFHEDRGDGILTVVPPGIATARLVDPLVRELAARLRQYNTHAGDSTRIQLRAALHVGPVGRDSHGLIGQALVLPFRIVDAPVLKELLTLTQADLAFTVSDYVYEHVVKPGAGLVDPAAFEHIEGQVKESQVSAWVHLAGRVVPPDLTLISQLQAADTRELVQEPTSARFPGPLPVAPPLGKLPLDVRGRDGLLGELRRALRRYRWRASRAFVITGMGGLGKSTVALAAAKMAKDRGYRVWWLSATDTALLTSGMLEVLRELGAPESVIAPVREGARTAPARAWEFLNGDHAGGKRWLLIFGGADHPAVLAGADATTPADGTGWLRADPAGMVIVTTRHRDPQVWGTSVTLRELKPLDEEASAEVLRDLAPEVADPGGHQARELSRRLGGLPLALHLAGAYLGSPFARWSTFAGYHEALDSVELPAALADIEGPGADVRADVQRTWDLSLDALAAEGRPQARMLLFLLSCFAPRTPIPAWLLRPEPLADLLEYEAGGSGKDDGWSRLRAGMQGLSHTGLIEISSGGGPAGVNALTVHPVVADANRSRLATIAATERTMVQNAAVALLEAAAGGLDPSRPGDWPAWRLLVPHLDAAIDLLADDLAAGVLARLLTVSAAGTEAMLGAGRLAAAEKLAQASVAAATFLSRDDPAAMTARGYLARTLVRCGRSGGAEMLYGELLADRLRVQGDDHIDTLATRHDLAAALGTQGRYGEAEQLYRQLLADDDRLRGPDHRETLAARSNLARVVGLQGRYAEAEELSRQVLDVQRQVLGPDHPDCLVSCQHLAWLAGKSGRYAEGEQMYRRALADRQRVLGDDHPDTLATRHLLARIVGLQGRYDEAEELCRQVLDDRRRLLGEDHSDNLSTRHRLARMLGLQGRYADAEPLFRQVLAARRRTPGEDHPDTLATGHRLGWLIGRQGRYSEAIEIVNEVLGGRRNVLGDDHPDTLAARETLAWLTGLRGKVPEAEELCREVLANRRRVLGEDHPDTLTTRGTLAWLTELQGLYADAEQQYRELLADRRRILGPSHPDTLIARQDVARMLGQKRRYAEAEELSREVLADRRRLLGDDHPDTLTSRATLARLASRQGRRAEAEELYRQVIADRTRVLGAHHPDTVAVRNELAQPTADRGTVG